MVSGGGGERDGSKTRRRAVACSLQAGRGRQLLSKRQALAEQEAGARGGGAERRECDVIDPSLGAVPHRCARAQGKTVSVRELEAHGKASTAWIVIDGDVYDVSKFAALHPGGELMLLEYAGQDVTQVFYGLHRHEVLLKHGPKLFVGRLETAEKRSEDNRIRGPGELSGVPYCEPPAWQGAFSPYHTPAHLELRKTVRKWLDENVRAEAEAGEISGKKPSLELFRKMGAAGLLAGRIGPGKHLKIIERSDIFGFPIDKFDYFAETILHEEVARLACPGFVDGMGSGMAIGLPPVLQFGPAWMQDKVGREVLMGEKRICLAITEPFAGSDVAGLKTTATKDPSGSGWILNGTKKW
jgi:cytochrome b involved in lipid metabolism